MKTKAAIAVAAGKPLEIVTVDLDGPKAGEVLVEIKASGFVTPMSLRVGRRSGGLFRRYWATRRGIVVDVGRASPACAKGDHVIPLYTPECRHASRARRIKPICARRSAHPRQGTDARRHSRFSIGKDLVHTTWDVPLLEFTVLPEIAVAKIRRMPLSTRCATSVCGVPRHWRRDPHSQSRGGSQCVVSDWAQSASTSSRAHAWWRRQNHRRGLNRRKALAENSA